MLSSIISTIFPTKVKLNYQYHLPCNDVNIFFVSVVPVYIELHLICAMLIRCPVFSIRLKSCEPEFLISTPERLLELVSIKAIDISNVSMLVSNFAILVSY